MYKIGYIDDESTQFDNYKRKITRYDKDLELVLLEGSKTKEFLNKIFEEQIDVMLIDYRMAGSYGFQGSTLINYINDHICDLECFILTAVDIDQIKDNLVPKRDRIPKTIFDTEGEDPQKVGEFTRFIETLKDSAIVFETRREEKIAQYMELLEKMKNKSLTLMEEEQFTDLYKVLSSYGLVEKLPQKLLSSDFDETLDTIINTGKQILDSYQG